MARWLGLFLLVGWPAAAPGQDRGPAPEVLAEALEQVARMEKEISTVVDRVAPAVTAITRFQARFDPKTGAVGLAPMGQGSGLVVSRDGLCLTNVHVVEGAARITVAMEGGRYEAVLKADSSEGEVKGDIALLQIQGKGPFPYVDWKRGRTDTLKPGAFVFAMGNPFGHAADGAPVVTWGVLSGKGRSASERGFLYVDVLQTDAEINPGNSGGPLFDVEGRYIGINGLISTRQARSNSGVGFAIPIDQIKLFLNRFLRSGGAAYGYHGLRVETVPGEKGARITHIGFMSPAGEVGMRRGDVIVKANGKRVRSRTDFVNVLGRLPERSPVTISFRRGTTNKLETFRLLSYEKVRETMQRRTGERPLPLHERGFLGAHYERAKTGLRLTKIIPGAAAARAKLAVGDILFRVEKTDVFSGDGLTKALQSVRFGSKVTVRYRRGISERKAILTLSPALEAAGGPR